MKKFFKNNLSNVILVCVLVIVSLIASINTWNNGFSFKQEQRKKFYDLCYEQKYIKSTLDRDEFYNYMIEEYKFESEEDRLRFWYNPDYECEQRVLKNGDKYSSFAFYNEVLNNKIMYIALVFVLPLLVMLVVSFDLFRKYKSKDTGKEIKKDYKAFVKKTTVSLYKPILSVFISLFILWIISIIFTGKIYSGVGLSKEMIESIKSINAWLIYLFTIAFSVGIFINVGTASSNINDKPLVSAIEAYLFYIIIWIGLVIPCYNLLITGEFVIGNITYVFPIQEMSAYPYTILIFMFIFYLISFTLTYLSFSKEENILKKCNK